MLYDNAFSDIGFLCNVTQLHVLSTQELVHPVDLQLKQLLSKPELAAQPSGELER